MLNHKGTRPIKTKRLLLRAVKKEDYKDMYRYTQKEEVSRYVSWNVHKSIDETKALCEMWAGEYKNSNRYNWAIVFDGTVIGSIDIVKIVDTTAFIGWQIDSDYWNMGIMTEAASAVRDYMFLEVGIDALNACYIKENIGSGKVMAKIGMKEITAEKYYEKLGDAKEHTTEIDGMPIGFCGLTKDEWVEQNVRTITVREFDKLGNIWDVEKCKYTELFRNQLETGNRICCVLDINGSFMAQGDLVLKSEEEGYTIEHERVYFSRLLVKREYRDTGIGQSVLKYLIGLAKRMNFCEISIGVDADNFRAIHIYKKAGFEVFETAKDVNGKYYKMLLKL